MACLLALAITVMVALPAATSADSSCTDTWTGDAGDGVWQSAENWSSGSVPDVGDIACIEAGTTVHVTGASNVVGVLEDHGGLVLSGGSLEIASTSEASSVASLSVEGGTLTGAGSLDVSGSFVWSGGTLSGSGETVLGSGVSGSIAAGGAVALTERKLVNEGSLTWSSGSVEGRSNAEIDNSGTFEVNADVPAWEISSSGLLNMDGSDVWIHNTGTVKKSSGSQYTQIGFQMDNQGSVDVESGQVIFAGGSHGSDAASGSWLSGEGASLAFSGGSFLLGSGVDMSGTVFFAGGDVQAGDIQAPGATLLLWSGGSTLDLSDASTSSHTGTLEVHPETTLTGAGSLDVSGSFVWSGGTLSGSGETVLGSGVSGSIAAGGAVALTERKLVNEGSLTWSSGSVEGRSNAEIDNSGTFEVNADVPAWEISSSGLLNMDGSDVWIHNTGTVKKSSGSQYTQIGFQMDNQGSVDVESGQVIFAGGSHGSDAASGSWLSGEGASLAFSGGSFLLGSGVDMSGTVFFAGGDVQAGDIQAPGATLLLWSGGSTLDLSDASTSSHTGTLEVHPETTLTGAGSLDVSGSLYWGGSSTMSGSGSTVLEAGANGTIEASSGCEAMHLEGRRLFNQGTSTFGSGTLYMSAGAEIQNAGSFKDNSESSCHGPQIQVASGGSAPSILNTGTFEKTAGGGTSTVAVSFDNDGSVAVQSGRLDFAGGGVPEQVATGSWATPGGSIVLSAGTFRIAEEVDLSGVEVSGASVERVPVAGPPRGTLNALAYASHTATVSGAASSVGTGFSSASIEVALVGSSEWQPLCGPLTPGMAGEFSCEWNTTNGSYPDGSYQLRAQLSDASTPPQTAPTTAIDVTVDNTPPTGSVAAPGSLKGPEPVEGTAADSGSGVSSWQLQIAPNGSGEWTNACPAQSTPISGSTYRCTLEAFAHPNGAYELRALVIDRAGNSYTTAPSSVTIANVAPTNTSPPAVSGTAWVGKRLHAGTGLWGGTPPLAYSYQWQRCDATGEGCSSIAEATESTYLLATGDVGHTLRVLVTAANPLSSATSSSAASAPVSETSCTDSWVGGGEGAWETPGNWSTGIVPGPTDVACIEGGVSVRVSSEGDQAGRLVDDGTLDIAGGGSMALADSSSEVSSLLMNRGSLSLSGALHVASSLAVDGETKIAGTGSLVVGAGATGTIGTGTCSEHLRLEGVNVVNDGVMTFGAAGGAGDGSIWMSEGAQLTNAGTFNDDSYDGVCFDGSSGYSIYDAGGSTPLITNTGTFDLSGGTEAIKIGVSVHNSGSVVAQTGALQFSDGGVGAGGTWSASAGATLELQQGSFALEGDTWSGAGAILVGRSAEVTAANVTADGATLDLNGGSLSIPHGSSTSLARLALAGGSLSVNGTLNASSSLAVDGDVTVDGSGTLALASGARGTMGTSSCSLFMTLDGVSLVNDGTLTFGGAGGSGYGPIWMENGARIDNAGTFSDGSRDSGCARGSTGVSIYDAGGAAPSVTNTGSFLSTGGAAPIDISVPFDNEGTVTVKSGILQLSGGGVAERVASGEWVSERGAETVMTSGTFLISEAVDLGARVEGTATIIWVSPNLKGWMSVQPQVSGAASVSGAAGQGPYGSFASTIEVTPAGAKEWKALCGPLTPELSGSFACTWATASGAYPDGSYELRAKLASTAGPPESALTLPTTTLVDNTPPTATVDALSTHGIGGSPLITGTASDSGSGVATWQLEIAPEGSSEWGEACPAQTTAISADKYGCYVNTKANPDGHYELRSQATDAAGNTHTSDPVALHIDNSALEGSVELTTPYVGGETEIGGSASSTGAAVESWALQISPIASGVWSSACAPQSTPFKEDEYHCAVSTTDFSDGTYELRAVVTDKEGDTFWSEPISTSLDNTPPFGQLSPLPESIDGRYEVQGYAHDAGSGIADWVLETAPTGSSEFKEACHESEGALYSLTYECVLNTSTLSPGSYQLRARITDLLGNSYTTPVLTTEIDEVRLSVVGAPTITGEPQVGSVLSASTGTWSGTGIIDYAYVWRRCNSAGEDCTEIASATDSHYVVDAEDVGHRLEATVTASNGSGEASSTSPASAVVEGGALANLSAPAITGTARVGGALEADPGRWLGAAPIAYAYQWQLCNAGGEACANIEGAAGVSYTPPETDVSDTLRVVVSAANSEGSASSTSAATSAVTAATTTGIRYLYDEAGRLSIVDGPSQGAAVYDWDPDGNLLSIQRHSSGELSVLATTPSHAPPGAQLDITGTGFDPDPTRDTVELGGVPAAVLKASTTDLVVTVPEGASEGAVTVTIGSGSASGPGTFKPFAVRRSAVTHTAAAATPSLSTVPRAASSTESARGLLPSAGWEPTARNRRDGNWATGLGPSSWGALPPLTSAHAKNGISGQTLDVDGEPLAGVTLSIQGTSRRIRTDSTGRFLLVGLPAGHQILVIEGASADYGRERYGRFTVGVEVAADKVAPLGYTIWMTPLDPAGDRKIPATLKRETTLTNPHIPGLEVRLPAGTQIHSADGRAVRHLNLTAIPIDRTPFPLPFTDGIPTYFTVQPGGAYLNKGAQIVYPNWGNLPPGQRVDFWNYDPADRGWYIYGEGSVSKSGRQVVPDPSVRVWEFTGAMITATGKPPNSGPCQGQCPEEGDPVDLATGLFVYSHTDLEIPDTTMPVALTRTYRPEDGNSYSFGVGTQSEFDIHLFSEENYKAATLVLPDGGSVALKRTSAGSGFVEAVYKAGEVSGAWEGAVMVWDSGHSQWDLRRRDGTTYIFGEEAPLEAIEDRNGSRITLVREDGTRGPVREVRGPHGHTIDLSYDAYNRIIQATAANSGETVRYTYNSSGRLASMTNPDGAVTRYSYDAGKQMTSVADARGNVLIANTFDAQGRVTKQSIAGKGTYSFEYTVARSRTNGETPSGAPALQRRAARVADSCSGCSGTPVVNLDLGFTESPTVELTHVVDPDGHTRDVYFGNKGLVSSVVDDPGSTPQRRTNYSYTGRNVTGIVQEGESEGHKASVDFRFSYDAGGDVTSATEEPRSPQAPPLTTSATFNEFAEPTTITNTLGQTTRVAYDSHGNPTSVIDPMGRVSTAVYDGEGQLSSVTDPQGNATSYSYFQGEETEARDALGHAWSFGYDVGGNLTSVFDPEGRKSSFTYDRANELIREVDPAGDVTSYTRDPDGNVVSLTDPRGHTQTASYNARDQLASLTDALGRTTSYEYDGTGRLTSVTEPSGRISAYTYDQLGRLSGVSYGAEAGKAATSSTAYTYGPLGELAGVTDSRAGSYALSYDPYGWLTGESGPQGSVGYSYDAGGERTGMTRGGETVASYAYNPAGQLTGIESPHGNVAIAYDHDGRTHQVTLPNGDSESFSYDAASQLTGIAYARTGGESIGDLQYGRDALGRVSTVSGTEARTSLPEAMSGASYDAANELTALGGEALSYDANGNLLSDGGASYTWNDRNQLKALEEGSTSWSFAYDPFGRRTAKTANGNETSYLYDGQNVLRESSGDASAELLDGPGLDQHFARSTSAGTDSYLVDQLGSTVALAGSSGAPSTEYTYGPFGGASASGASTTNPYTYTGLESLANGLQYNRARFYNPGMARFVSQDPLGMAGSGVDLYQYAGSDPVDLVDPTGLESWWEAGANGFVGGVDALTGGATSGIRSALGLAQPNASSAAYQAGTFVGIAVAVVVPGDEEAAVADVAGQGSRLSRLRSFLSDERGEFDPFADFRQPSSETKAVIGDAAETKAKDAQFADKLTHSREEGGNKLVRLLGQLGRLIHPH